MERVAQSGTRHGLNVKHWAALSAVVVAVSCSSDTKHAQKSDTRTPRMHPADADENTQDASAAQDSATPSPATSGDASASAGDCAPDDTWPFGPNSNVVIECGRCAPHGTCNGPDPNQGECRCESEYTGASCEHCADGFVERGSECVTPCQAAGVQCNGVCSGTFDAPSCECRIGYAGLNCSQCAPGFGPASGVFDGGVRCVPTCDGGCNASEMCTAPSRDEQRCECVPGYERNSTGTCAWRGLIADPNFEHGCTDWHLFRRGNPGDEVITELTPGKLTLSVDHHCSVAGAKSEAFLPAQGEVENAAIAITASGTSGANLYVGFDEMVFPGTLGTPLAGTGATKRYVVCLPIGAARKAAVTFTVGELGTCAETLEDDFEVRSVEVTSDDQCAESR